MNLGLGEILGGRYKIVTQLGQGGFGKTFIAEDKHLPGDHQCVVKQLKPQATDPLTLQIARRLFETEAKVLHQLGRHNQIPQLFAYFEEDQEFYLVQELIIGADLSQELTSGKRLNEHQVISLLRDILEILEFVHAQHVIHRDLNPHNLIRRQQDGKLVLIDFGAVKQVTTQVANGEKSSFTIAIGTPGYRPSEQANGHPKLSSDIYAIGIVGIQALTGLLPHQLPIDSERGEINWQEQATVSPEFAKVLDKMVRYDFRERYSSAASALLALNDLTTTTSATCAVSPGTAKLAVGRGLPVSVLNKALMAIAFLGVGLVVTLSLVKVIQSTNATGSYKQGETLADLKRYEAALAAYDRAVELRPEYAAAWQGRGKTLVALKQYADALEAYDQAIQLQPNALAAWNGRGKALASLQRYDEAIASFDAAVEIQPDNLEAWNERGNVQMKVQRYSAAIASFDKALDVQADYSPAWYKRGIAQHNLRQYEDAVKSFDKALDSKPDSAQSWYSRGNALINLDRYAEAVESYDQAVRFQPNLAGAWYSRGSALSSLGEYESAVASFDRVVKLNPKNAAAWYNRGWSLHQLQRYEEAVDAYDQALELRPNAEQTWYNRGNALYNLKRYQKAIASYDQAVSHKPDHSEAWFSRGNTLVSLERYQDAIESYDKALQYEPDYREASDARDKAQEQLRVSAQQEQQVEAEEAPEAEKRRESQDE